MCASLVTGASGYVGGRLIERLHAAGHDLGAVVRDSSSARLPAGVRVHEADMLDPHSLAAIDGEYLSAFYLVHSMGRGADGDYEQRDAAAARNFARWARTAGVEQVVYLGGLGEHPGSAHLRSRQRVGEILRDEGPPLTWLRAGMIVGSGSESFRTLRYLVQRLPVMIAPSWLTTRTQAIAIGDVISYLTASLDVSGARDREIEIGAPEILCYGDMLDRMADALRRRRPLRIPVPLLTPWLSSHWIGLVTPVDPGVARPLVESLSTETTIHDPSGMALYDIAPAGFDNALRAALDEAG